MEEIKPSDEEVSLMRSCVGSVRKAKVALIRKTIKKIKILKSCKNEALKDKKLKKCDRMVEKMQILKKLKEEEVIKFALSNSDLSKFFEESMTVLRDNALASLAKHEAVSGSIKTIRQQIPNWEEQLPLLLQSLKKKERLAKKNDIEVVKDSPNSEGKEVEGSDKEKKELVLSEGESVDVQNPKPDECVKEELGKKQSFKPEREKFKEPVRKFGRSYKDVRKNNNFRRKAQVEVDMEEEEIKRIKNQMKKIDDPFFIEKKVVAPKLYQHDRETNNFQDGFSQSRCNAKPFRSNDVPTFGRSREQDWFSRRENEDDSVTSWGFGGFNLPKSRGGGFGREENFPSKSVEQEPSTKELHPSWAAKKTQLIKPFQGKKITFSNE